MKQVYINCVMPTIEMFKIESITTDRAVAIQEFNKHPLKKSYNEIRYVLFYIEMSDADYNKLISIPQKDFIYDDDDDYEIFNDILYDNNDTTQIVCEYYS